MLCWWWYRDAENISKLHNEGLPSVKMTVEFKTDATRAPSAMMSIATPLRDSQSYVTTKGLTNHPGQNNCFLNSSIQVLWHLDAFRRSFRDLTGHACLAESCIFCALKELFSELQHSRAKALPPDSLRKALADSFLDQQRFQIGFMDDAAECFENMLLRIHEHIAHREPEDACSAPHCISHQKFAMTLVEQSVCGNCGATTEPMSFTQMVQYVSTSSLVHQFRLTVDQTGRPDPFGRLLQKAGNMGDARPCPATCGSVTQMCRILMNRPEIVSIGLVWNSEKPSIEHIIEVFSCIETTLSLNQVFNTVTDSRWAETTTHNLVGMVTYYGKHYSTFFFHTKLMEWIFLDDATVRDVGPRWEQVVDKCKKGKFQPLLLLYATPNGTPVNLEYAPKLNTPFQTKNHNTQQLLRRSVTPSPEKPNIGNTRRAITPNPENSPLNHKPPLPKPYNDYQNLSVIQKNINGLMELPTDQLDGRFKTKQHEVFSLKRKSLDNGKPQINIHRTLSNGSSSGVESGTSIPDHMNVPRRRDSGNWSGDRNSASSASSTTMENPYLYLVGKVPPGSPTKLPYDAGYDSHSLSSNDSSNNMTTLQHLMKTGHLAQIPEDYTNIHSALAQQNSLSCDVLCNEADELLIKSRQLEDAHDLVLALALCNAAATKARAAMNAPYNNPQTLTLARMKHNTCIMRARSLHRRMTQQNQPQNKEGPLEIRHTREGSSGSGRHSRQNSREKGHHSRQSSRELLVQQEKEKAKPIKSIEIYATLPKKKDALKARLNAISIDDEEYLLYAKPPERESRSIFSRSKNKEKDLKVKEKRSRSEDRNKVTNFSVAPEITVVKEASKKGKQSKDKEEKDDKKDKDGKNKKQHKIRRKLLMGGLIRRKNRSMPDLTDSNAEDHRKSPQCVDDSHLSLPEASPAMTGYLSEGHLEFTGTSANPNLERSKLMRKSFHGSAGKILTAAKVPPPPPLRTTSQLSRSKSNVSDTSASSEHYNGYGDTSIYHNLSAFNQPSEEQSSMSLPYYGNCNSSYDDESFEKPSSHTVVTRADVHQEKSSIADDGIDEVDCFPSRSAPMMLDLPPYPSPAGSAIHSRQASEEFPPPPPPLDLSALDEYLPKADSEPNSLLAQLQDKRKQIFMQLPEARPQPSTIRSSGDTWLKELQAKQAALKNKKSEVSKDVGVDEVNTQRYLPGETMGSVKSVKDLASKFEANRTNGNQSKTKSELMSTIAPEQIAEEIREVEMITSAVNKVFGGPQDRIEENNQKARSQKKKSVSFCDQVILVATAEEQEEETYIPNPILERVLRSAVNNPEANTVKQEIRNLRETMNQQCPPAEPKPVAEVPQIRPNDMVVEQPLYVRRNSIEHMLNHEPPRSTAYALPSYSSSPVQPSYSPALQQPQQYYGMKPDEHQYYGYQKAQQAQQFYNRDQFTYQQPQNYALNSVHQMPPRQSPYQPVPYNSAMHPNYYGHVRQQNPQNTYGYPTPSPSYNQPNMRHSASSPGYLASTLTPSPVPSVSSCNNYCPEAYRNGNQSPFQRMPPELQHFNHQQEYQRHQGSHEVYQRVPPPHSEEPIYPQSKQLSPYQQVPSPKHFSKKTVSFQPGTKGCESPTPKAVITPIVVNNANNSIPTDKTKCNLCRKKNVVALNVYCKDCEFYMSRFNPKS